MQATQSSWDSVVAVMLQQELRVSLTPPRRLALGIALAPVYQPSVLVVGGRLPPLDSQRLIKAGCTLEFAPTWSDALQLMDERPWDVVVTHVHVDGDADGIRIVRSFKQSTRSEVAGPPSRLLKRYAAVPFVILPLAESTEFALFHTAQRWFLGDTGKLSLSDAILRASL